MGPTEMLAQQIMDLADNQTKNGTLSIMEVSAHLSGTPHAQFAKWLTTRRMFFKFDTDKSGNISFPELVKAIQLYITLDAAQPQTQDINPKLQSAAVDNVTSISKTFDTLLGVVDYPDNPEERRGKEPSPQPSEKALIRHKPAKPLGGHFRQRLRGMQKNRMAAKIPPMVPVDLSDRQHGFIEPTSCWDAHLKIASQREKARKAVNGQKSMHSVEMWWPWWNAKSGAPHTSRPHHHPKPQPRASGAYTHRGDTGPWQLWHETVDRRPTVLGEFRVPKRNGPHHLSNAIDGTPIGPALIPDQKHGLRNLLRSRRKLERVIHERHSLMPWA